jgi:hypothetical protein
LVGVDVGTFRFLMSFGSLMYKIPASNLAPTLLVSE